MKNQIATKKPDFKNIAIPGTTDATPQNQIVFELGGRIEPLQVAPSVFLKIDHATIFDNIAVISGWMSDTAEIKFHSTLNFLTVPRPDADSAVKHATKGFITVVELGTNRPDLICTVFGKQTVFAINFSSTAEEISNSVQYFSLHSKDLLPYYIKSRLLSEYLSKNCPDLPAHHRINKRGGHLDNVKSFANFGYVAYGWAMSKEATNFWLVSSDGHWHPIEESIRFNRPDVYEAFADSFGVRAAESAFLCVVKTHLMFPDTPIRLVAAINEGVFVVHTLVASSGPQTPLSYAKWAFSLSVPPSKFFNRLNRNEGDLIEHLISQNRVGYPTEFEVWKTANIALAPQVSVIVPLYGRADFVEYQLSQFTSDPDFKNGFIDLIYVVDDSTLIEPLLNNYHHLFRLYGVPFKIVWGKINRGYSGANNLGIKVATGNTILFLNSDVFPSDAGWARKMRNKLLSDTSIGAVGTRLDYSDGSVQHQGMSFEYSCQLGVWLNEHPMRGLDLPQREDSYDVEAATGACLIARTEDIAQVGGMDEGFLIGDFEDSDLCLKLRDLRGRIVIAAETRLVHLERQSFHNLGSSDFRSSIVKFNAWRHSRRWGNAIAILKEKLK